MKISEVFDTHTRAELIRNTSDLFVVKSVIGNRTIKFTAAKDNDDTWQIDFIEQSSTKGDTFNKTGSGNEMQVFSFVIDCIKLLINKHKPDMICFNSEKSDVNRSRVYAAISRKVKIPGYHMEINIDNNPRFDEIKIVKDNTENINESRYSEEPGSSFTHNGEEYYLNPLISVSRNLPVHKIPIDDLQWILKYSDDNRDVEYADINIPVLIGKWNNKLVVLDGLHRLKKSIELGKEFIPGRFVSDKLLSYFKIKNKI